MNRVSSQRDRLGEIGSLASLRQAYLDKLAAHRDEIAVHADEMIARERRVAERVTAGWFAKNQHGTVCSWSITNAKGSHSRIARIAGSAALSVNNMVGPN